VGLEGVCVFSSFLRRHLGFNRAVLALSKVRLSVRKCVSDLFQPAGHFPIRRLLKKWEIARSEAEVATMNRMMSISTGGRYMYLAMSAKIPPR